MQAPRQRRGPLALARLAVFVLTLGYIGYVLTQDLPSVLRQILPLAWAQAAWLALATLSIGVCTLASGTTFYLLARARADAPVPFRQALGSYVTANLMRHVPGRFLGVAYQASAPLPGLTAADMVRINVMQLLAGIAGNILVGSGIIVFHSGRTILGVVLCSTTLPVTTLVLMARVPRRIRAWLRAHGPKRAERLLDESGYMASYRDVILPVLVQTGAWLPYLWAWHLLGEAFAPLRGQPLVPLAASYGVAWVAGFLAFVSPGGLGVREAIFLLLGGLTTSREPLAFLTVFARLWNLAADVLTWLVTTALFTPRAIARRPVIDHARSSE